MAADRYALTFFVPLSLAVVACSGGSGESASGSDTASSTVTVTATATATATDTASGSESESATTTNSGSASNSASGSTTSSGETETTATTTDSSTATTTASTTASTTDSTTMMASVSDTSSESDSDSSPPPGCGNGVLDPGEECDNGPANGPGEACKANCVADVCGDGDKGPEEECDEGPDNGPDGGCSAECAINPSACGEQSYDAMLEILPVDIIINIDNSGSMSQEIKGVQDNINQNFAQIIENSGIDYRVIMVTRHGNYSSYRVCIEAPLSGIPQGGCQNPPAQPVFNPGKFYHYSASISSHDGLCKLGTTFNATVKDDFNLAPNGWQEWLREEALKVFVVITDDGVSCSWNGTLNDSNNVNGGNTVATAWQQKLHALSPLHFGDSPQNRNFQFYSIVAMAYNNPPTAPYTPKDPIITGECPTAADPGTGYQALSINTEALRFPLCNTSSYDVIFQAIADGVIKGAKIVCEFPIPEAPMGETLDLDSIKVQYTPGQGVPEIFDKVPSADQCTPASFYLEDGLVKLCPDACDAVQADKDANIQVKFACEPIDPG